MTRPSLPLHPGYWCECTTRYTPDDTGLNLVASIDVDTADHAVQWIRVTLQTITPALQRNAARDASTWITSGHTRMLHALTQGQPDALTVTYRNTQIQWTARPVLFLPLAHRQGTQLPDCAEQFLGSTAATRASAAE